MKNLVLAAFTLSALLGSTAHAQVKSVVVANQPSNSTAGATAQPTTRRARVMGPNSKPVPLPTSSALQGQAKSDFNSNLETSRNSSGSSVETNKASANNTERGAAKPASTASETAATQIYRVGIRDVLDIQLDQVVGKSSTLFTVQPGGMLEYPLAGAPFSVHGMTTSEIATILRQRIKIFDNPTIAVKVRDYASHTVNVSGFVAAPGTKILRREAVPLYAVLSEALAMPEAVRATISRQGRYPIAIDLKDPAQAATLVVPGDIIKVAGPVAGPTEFFFVSGEIASPGQKPFHSGLTLTQAIIASGGTTSKAGAKIKLSRQTAGGRLQTEEYNLKKIQAGKTPDPDLQNGDRIEVTTSN